MFPTPSATAANAEPSTERRIIATHPPKFTDAPLDLLNRPLRLLLILLGAVGLPVFLLGPYFLQPWKDAVILFQYSTNLALTRVISFYPGGPHTEGATDFLWMIRKLLIGLLVVPVLFCFRYPRSSNRGTSPSPAIMEA